MNALEKFPGHSEARVALGKKKKKTRQSYFDANLLKICLH